MSDEIFWKGKRVLVTGHTGFKGSWLSVFLKKMGANVFGIALNENHPNAIYHTAKLDQIVESHIANIQDRALVASLVAEINPEICFHLAAQPLVRQAYRDPVETYATNVMGTVNILNALLNQTNLKCIINVTTDKCYQNREWYWSYREDDVLGGDDPYSSSKAASEIISKAYRKSFFERKQVGLATARAGNVIGGGDWAEDRLIPDVIRSSFNGTPIVIRHPNSIRPWQHVIEPIGGYIRLAKKLYYNPKKYSGAWNFGPNEDDCVSVLNILTHCQKHIDFSIEIDKNSTGAFKESRLLKLDSAKANQELNWSTSWNIETAICETLDWYKKERANDDMYSFMIKQINKYLCSNKCVADK